MTLSDLLDSLENLPSEAPVRFETPNGAVGDGYHITELKHAHITSIDCGARTGAWDQAVLQLLDGKGNSPMQVGKMRGILRQSLSRISALGDAPLQVEFGHSNSDLSLYGVKQPNLDGAQVVIALTGEHAVCKPAKEMKASASGSGCCGASNDHACCA